MISNQLLYHLACTLLYFATTLYLRPRAEAIKNKTRRAERTFIMLILDKKYPFWRSYLTNLFKAFYGLSAIFAWGEVSYLFVKLGGVVQRRTWRATERRKATSTEKEANALSELKEGTRNESCEIDPNYRNNDDARAQALIANVAGLELLIWLKKGILSNWHIRIFILSTFEYHFCRQ